jgi:hypothetical protein
MSGQFTMKTRLTPSTAVKWVNALSQEERQFVLVALQKKIQVNLIPRPIFRTYVVFLTQFYKVFSLSVI